jgi:hypothetical protein
MTIDLEGDLRREFDAAIPPSSLTFHPESVVRQGNRTIRRHRIIAGASAAMAVALVATGATLLTRPHDTAAPQPATRTTATSGIVRAQAGYLWGGQSEIQFDRDPSVKSNVRYSVVFDGRRHELGTSSTGRPGQKPDATWKSGMVEGHPVTIGLVPSSAGLPTVRFADGGSYGVGGEELKGTGYTMFYIGYDMAATDKEPARPSELASIRWSGPTGMVDGIEGKHRLTGRSLTVNNGVSVDVVLRPAVGGRTTVFGTTHFRTAKGGYGFDLSAATTGPSGVAVVTGRQPIASKVLLKGQDVFTGTDGPPIAAGILPPGATDIGVILTTGEVANGLPVTERLPDGRVIFAIKAESAQPSQPSKDSIKAVTWTNADGSQGRQDVTQKPR